MRVLHHRVTRRVAVEPDARRRLRPRGDCIQLDFGRVQSLRRRRLRWICLPSQRDGQLQRRLLGDKHRAQRSREHYFSALRQKLAQRILVRLCGHDRGIGEDQQAIGGIVQLGRRTSPALDSISRFAQKQVRRLSAFGGDRIAGGKLRFGLRRRENDGQQRAHHEHRAGNDQQTAIFRTKLQRHPICSSSADAPAKVSAVARSLPYHTCSKLRVSFCRGSR